MKIEKEHAIYPDKCWCKTTIMPLNGVMRRLHHVLKEGEVLIEALGDEKKVWIEK